MQFSWIYLNVRAEIYMEIIDKIRLLIDRNADSDSIMIHTDELIEILTGIEILTSKYNRLKFIIESYNAIIDEYMEAEREEIDKRVNRQ